MEYYSASKENENNAICSNMDRPGEYHTKWSKSGRKINTVYHSCGEFNFKNDTNEHIYKTESASQT